MTWFQEGPAVGVGGPAVDAMLGELCEAKRTALLATPYLSFESRFLEREGNELRMWATMSKATAEHTLMQNPLKIRFPWALTMWAGATRVLGYEQAAKRRYLRLAVPERLAPDERREHPRAERGLRVQGTLGNDALTVVRISVEDLSRGGARLLLGEPVLSDDFPQGGAASLSLTRNGGERILAGVRVVHGDGLHLGVAFQPPLDGEVLATLQAWLAPRLMEAKKAWEQRAEVRAQALMALARAKPEGLLLVTGLPELEAQLRPLLEGLPALRHALPIMADLRKQLDTPPRLAFVHVPQGGLEDRRRLRALMEALHDVQVVLLAAPSGMALAQELSTEFKAPSLAWNPSLGPFLQRMVVGLLKRGEST